MGLRAGASAGLLVVLLVHAFGVVASGTQAPPATTSPSRAAILELIERADRSAEQRDVADARERYTTAAARAHDEGVPDLEARALAGLGRLATREGNYAESRDLLERALALATSAGDNAGAARIANSIGVAASNQGKEADARTWYEQAASFAEKAGDLRMKANALSNIAMLESMTVEQSIALQRDVVAIARTLGDRALEARGRHSWGDRLFKAGDFAEAMDQLEQAAALYEQVGDNESLATVYTSLGRLNRAHGRPEDAIPLYDKAFTLQKAQGDTLGMVQTLNATAVAYGSISDFRRARDLYEQAYALALETKSARAIDFMRGNLGGGLLDVEDFRRAADLLEQVVARENYAYPAIRHMQLSRAYLALGRLDEARTHADRAVELAASEPTQQPNVLIRRAAVRERQGDLSGAQDDARAAIAAVERMRAKLVPLDFLKQGFSETYTRIYSMLIAAQVRKGQVSQAIETAETARSRAFLDLLATRDVRLNERREAEVVALRQLEKELRARGVDPITALDGDDVAGPHVDVAAGVAPLLEKWKTARPEVLSFVAVHPQRVTELAASARRLNSTLVTYWVAEDTLFIGVIAASGRVDMRRVDVSRNRLTTLVASVVALPGGSSPGPIVKRGQDPGVVPVGTRTAWQQLYRLLIAPVRPLMPPHGNRLTIVPHGPLMRLPFAALMNEQGRYLIEGYAINYVPAGGLLEFTARKRAMPSPPQFLFVADPALPPVGKHERPLPPLPGAREEVRAIARALPPKTGSVLEGARADKRSVSAAMSAASVLHFATHSIADDRAPLDSYLALAAADGGKGRLTAQEIYRIDLRADLVVLSSCRSGGGAVTGEGISALSRAFFYAGAPSIVASVWDVPDQGASRLFPRFYSSWRHGRPLTESLRSAQLQLIADLRAGRVRVRTIAGEVVLPEHPALWAGFILLGEP